MTEVTIPEGYPHREGHRPNIEIVFLDLYRLLSIFLSSKNFAMLRDEHGLDTITALQEPEFDEITRILISSAITARIIDDRNERFLSKEGSECGKLINNLNNPKEDVPLTLREACNKIIHAEKIRTDLEEENHKKYFNPIMYFYGKYKGLEWKATLDVIQYATKYYELLNNV